MMELAINPNAQAQLVEIVFYYAQSSKKVKMTKKDVEQPTLTVEGQEPIVGDVDIALYLCRSLDLEIYPDNFREEIDNIVRDYPNYQIGIFNNYLTFRTYMIGNVFTVADIAVFSCLHNLPDALFRIKRWADLVSQKPHVKRYLNTHKKAEGKAGGEDKGKGKGKQNQVVCTRFAPEPSGYLHIGHAKAALCSENYARERKGIFVLRFDDTNPKNENKDFEHKILEDVALLDLHPDRQERTSDQVPMILDTVKEMIDKGLAYVDDTPFDTIKEQRLALQPSTNRDNTPERNHELFNEMLKGTEKGYQCVARAKIDYKSSNGCMRDPVIARCIKVENAPPGQGPVYPTYDLCCPIVDSKNGITHAMRSWEYQDRDHQYRWFIEKLGLRPVQIISFSRLSFNHTVLGKRYLRRLVEQGKASGWDDPRFPTIRGLRRRGLQPAALKEFCNDQGASRNQNVHDWDKLWSMNRKLILKTCHRVMSVSEEEKIPLNIQGIEGEGEFETNVLQTDPKQGTKKLYTAPMVWIPVYDAQQPGFEVGKKATLCHWSNIMIDAINKECDKIVSVDAHHLPDDKNFTNTPKLNWIHPTKNTKIIMREWNHLLKVKQLGENQDVLDALSDIPFADTVLYCDTSLEQAKKGEIFQLERRAEIIIDQPAQNEPAMTFLIPSGFQKKSMGLPTKIVLFTPEDD